MAQVGDTVQFISLFEPQAQRHVPDQDDAVGRRDDVHGRLVLARPGDLFDLRNAHPEVHEIVAQLPEVVLELPDLGIPAGEGDVLWGAEPEELDLGDLHAAGAGPLGVDHGPTVVLVRDVVVEQEDNVFPMIPTGASISDILLEP